MSLAPIRYVLTEKALSTWLGIRPGRPLSEATEEVATHVFDVLRGIESQSWLALEPSILNAWLTQYSDLEMSGVYRKIVKLLRRDRVRDFTNLCKSAPDTWAALPEDFDAAARQFINVLEPAYFWCEPGVEKLPHLEKQLSQLFQGIAEIDIYDSYLIHNLTSSNHRVDPSLREHRRNRYVQTLDFICNALLTHGGSATINLRCPIRAEYEGSIRREEMEDIESIYRSLPGLRELLLSIATKHKGNIRFVVELRAERPVHDHGRSDMSGEWLHGRFIVVPGACIVSSDRSMDFVGLRYLSDGGRGIEKIALLDNLLVRWAPNILSPDELSRRWSSLTPMFSGQNLVSVGF